VRPRRANDRPRGTEENGFDAPGTLSPLGLAVPTSFEQGIQLGRPHSLPQAIRERIADERAPKV